MASPSSIGKKGLACAVAITILHTSLFASALERLNSWIKGGDNRKARVEAEALRSDEKAFSITLQQDERQPQSTSPAWVVRVGRELGGVSWLGTSYKNVPYTEGEFNDLRNKKIKSEVDRLKKDHIARKRAARSREGGQEQIEGLLDDLLAGGDQAKENEDAEMLKDFNEEQVYRRVTNRTFVAQSRPVVIPSIYVQSRRGDLFCLELETGLTSWVVRLEVPLLYIPFETEKELFIVDGGTVKIIDKRSGFITDHVRLDRAVFPKVYFNDDRIYSISFEDRALSWQVDKTYRDWLYRMPGAVVHGIFGHSSGLILPLDTGEIVSLSFDGKEKWNFISKSYSDEKIYLERLMNKHSKAIEKEKGDARKSNRPEDRQFIRKHEREIDLLQSKILKLDQRTRGQYVAEPLLVKDDVIIGCTDFQLYSLSRFSGIPNWSYSCGAEVKAKPHQDSKWIWQRDELRRVHRVDLKTGKGEIVLRGVDRILAPKNDGVLVLSNGRLHAWSNKASTDVVNLETAGGHMLMASSNHNLLVSLRGKDGLVRAYSMESFRALR